ncbi:MAG: hypothetical protein LAN70_17655 [Acidobacteriia bacterium]|nr:hypothetical protein [Terriglobia bacterium]
MHDMMFSRRTLQRVINENARWMLPSQVQRHVDLLNGTNTYQCIETEWEVVVLNAVSKLGTVRHEPTFSGRKAPDVHFSSKQGEEFIADITSVSDKGLHAANRFDLLWDELRLRTRWLRDKGVHGSFSLRVGDYDVRPRRGGPPLRLKVPERRLFEDRIFNERFRQFLAEIVANPGVRRTYEVNTSDTSVAILYTPRASTSSGSHASYTGARSVRQNAVFRALAKKWQKLKETGFNGYKGIILCDGGCDTLRSGRQHDWTTYELNEIIAEFFRQHSLAAFVLLLRMKHVGNLWNVGPGHWSLDPALYLNCTIDPMSSELKRVLGSIHLKLANPAIGPMNARYRLQWAVRAGKMHEGESNYGGMTVSSREIKISSRVVQEVLAGKIDQATFVKQYDSGGGMTPFMQMLSQGRLIKGVRFERSAVPQDDDDWLVFEFGEPDAAVFPFTVPSMGKP